MAEQPEFPVPPTPMRPPPGTPVALDPRDLVQAMRADEVVALLDKEIG